MCCQKEKKKNQGERRNTYLLTSITIRLKIKMKLIGKKIILFYSMDPTAVSQSN